MRLRKKKNLENRILECGNILAIYEQYDFYKLQEEEKFRLIETGKVFGNNNPTFLEIGCGKGGFITEMATLHPEINFLAAETNSISRIFLNFSCPWPKQKYANQRLTNPRFLSIYQKLLTKDGDIIQKTDSPQMFEYSVEQLSQFGFGLFDISCDLHNSKIENEVMTEYEKYFSGIGKPIFRLAAKLND